TAGPCSLTKLSKSAYRHTNNNEKISCVAARRLSGILCKLRLETAPDRDLICRSRVTDRDAPDDAHHIPTPKSRQTKFGSTFGCGSSVVPSRSAVEPRAGSSERKQAKRLAKFFRVAIRFVCKSANPPQAADSIPSPPLCRNDDSDRRRGAP